MEVTLTSRTDIIVIVTLPGIRIVDTGGNEEAEFELVIVCRANSREEREAGSSTTGLWDIRFDWGLSFFVEVETNEIV